MGYVTELLGPPAPDFDPRQVVAALRRYRGAAFEETDLERAALWAVQKSRPLPVTTQDLIFPPLALESRGREQLEAMVELQEVKETVKRLCARLALEQRRALAGQPMAPACRNLAFSGPPGTGKSVTARLLAQILREEGVGTGRFVEAGREQLVGTYLGKTSPKVAALFEKARGGVLFIDEAGALLSSRDDDAYVVEAVNALVRHRMELHPETLVIFATYPGEMERLLASDPGLSSRVAQVLDFPGYDDETLWQILGHLARQDGFCPAGGGKSGLPGFLPAAAQTEGGLLRQWPGGPPPLSGSGGGDGPAHRCRGGGGCPGCLRSGTGGPATDPETGGSTSAHDWFLIDIKTGTSSALAEEVPVFWIWRRMFSWFSG